MRLKASKGHFLVQIYNNTAPKELKTDGVLRLETPSQVKIKAQAMRVSGIA